MDDDLEERVYALEREVRLLTEQTETMRRVIGRLVPILSDSVRQLADIQHELKRIKVVHVGSGDETLEEREARLADERDSAEEVDHDVRHPHHIKMG